MTVSALRRSLLLVAAAFGMMTTAGCKQSLGDPCQVSSDCDDGLVCVLPVGGTPQVGGICEPPEGIDMGSDAGVDTDGAVAADLAITSDGPPPANDDFATAPDL